jgi:hypothetical protein
MKAAQGTSSPQGQSSQGTISSPSGSVVLGQQGQGPVVLGKQKPPLTRTRYDVVKTLLEAGQDGLTVDELAKKSHHGDAVNSLKKLARSDPDWGAVISLPGSSGMGYRIQ